MELLEKEKLIVQLKERIHKAKKNDEQHVKVLQKLLEKVINSASRAV